MKSILSDFFRGICPSTLTKKVHLDQFLPSMPITQLCLFGPPLCPSQEIKEIKQTGYSLPSYLLFFPVLPNLPAVICQRTLVGCILCRVFSCNWWEGDARTKSQIVPFLNKNKHD